MNSTGDAETNFFHQHDLVATLDRKFSRLHLRSTEIIQSTPDLLLYQVPNGTSNEALRSIGESVLRSAAAVEQTFGGINSNLWDDPFEWTLPEQLSTPAAVLAHLDEVESVRRHAFATFTDDSCLMKAVAAPSGLVILAELLLKTLTRAEHYQTQARSILRLLSGNDVAAN